MFRDKGDRRLAAWEKGRLLARLVWVENYVPA
jgi:hypothetical protein